MNTPSLFQVLHYVTPSGEDVYEEWLGSLDAHVADRVDAYARRMAAGNFGVTRPVGQGILELKIHYGPGYRVYYLHDRNRIVVLLCGGDKASQAKDIWRAKAYAADYWRHK